jgi:hypothetical protein
MTKQMIRHLAPLLIVAGVVAVLLFVPASRELFQAPWTALVGWCKDLVNTFVS